ncbi:PDR/VanB family oxidoreductase [Nocardia caishijiensis]|uniref:Ferredoxin-NADP reductase n=1 Tax=Nocardia caishijiensis TaxID=184756 RepID=A0ABQ6YG77_9NOCA|nr:PDR/VanB family oxidoreductase [Nocardia caishijiensis]KAF0844783.1 ferredoxin-NADP reductase [Nocardia caishijiensis]
MTGVLDTMPEYTPPVGLRALAAVADGYRQLFVESRAASLISQPKPVRHSGFEIELSVDRIEPIAEDVVSVTLRSPVGAVLPPWRPGSHIDIVLPSGRLRQYSLCGDHADRSRYRIAVRRIADGGGGSVEVHEQLAAGASLRIRGPRNAFDFIDAPSYLFVAGGIGITPILPMVRAAARAGARWQLIYLGRSRSTMPFLDELATFGGDNIDIRPDDEFGVPRAVDLLGRAEPGASVYVCGPPPLLEAAQRCAFTVDPTGSLHTERFSALPVVDGEAFDVTLARSGTTIRVAADETVLAALTRGDRDVVYSCRQGFCGTCKVAVVAGEVRHRDRKLLDSERGSHMLTCVSRAAGSSLVLDL